MPDSSSRYELWLSKMRAHLKEERYSARTSLSHLAVARDFLMFLDTQCVEVEGARASSVERYLGHSERTYRRRHGRAPNDRSWRFRRSSGVHMLLRLVQGQWPPASGATTPAEILHKEILENYSRWMGDLRGLSLQTVEDGVAEADRFLGWVGECAVPERLGALTRLDVDLYMKYRAGSLHRHSLNGLATRLRSLLRFLYATGQTMNDLAMTVIAPPVHAFEGIPSAMLPADVGKVLEAARQDGTAKGIRDYAILLLIAKYGVRAGEVTALRLDDVDWRKELIRIRHSKTGAMSCLPLLPDTGEALLNYLQQSRPRTSFREIFIRCQAPYRPFKDGSSLYGMVQWRLAAANVVPIGKRGPHSFRHARAVSMLRASVPVKEIGDLLGHRAADSTLVYLKLATDDLRAVAMEIPAGVKK